jgi:hypothetical protein
MRSKARVIPILVVLALGGSLVGCGGTPAPQATPNGDGGTLVTGPSATGTPTGEPSPTAPPPPPASSTLASKAGFVWAYDPANPAYVASGPYHFNSAGGAVNISRTAAGRYLVSFVGLGGPGGVAHAQAYGGNSNYCNVMNWNGEGGNENVTVHCFNAAGTLTDSTFVANWAAGSQDTARFGYLWAEQPTNTNRYNPSASYRYDAVNSDDLAVERLSTGRYLVHMPTSAPVDEPVGPWAYQVTAYSTNNRCKLHSVDREHADAVVACRTPAGADADTLFSISYQNLSNMLGRQDRRFDISGQGLEPPIDPVANPATGLYVATLPAMGADQGHVVSLATGTSATYCHIRDWVSNGSDLAASTVCFDTAGAAAASGFLVSATW